ncbi:hypothetical protein BDR05DRAFT_960301 [Suillus weaverae]|nr:hypothetical protein BDR05DRAFT_960301 [Suillus weaverae]
MTACITLRILIHRLLKLSSGFRTVLGQPREGHNIVLGLNFALVLIIKVHTSSTPHSTPHTFEAVVGRSLVVSSAVFL